VLLMLRHRLFLCALLSCLLSAWHVVGTGRLVWSKQVPSTVYSLAVLRALVERAPAHWLGRAVVVRALAAPCPWWGATVRLRHCADQPLVLIGCATDAPTEPLPLVRRAPSALWAILRRLPLVGSFAPAPHALPWGAVGTYRVQLRAAPTCPAPSCYEAVLVDAAPDALGEG
jgi:hypothetical protein